MVGVCADLRIYQSPTQRQNDFLWTTEVTASFATTYVTVASKCCSACPFYYSSKSSLFPSPIPHNVLAYLGVRKSKTMDGTPLTRVYKSCLSAFFTTISSNHLTSSENCCKATCYGTQKSLVTLDGLLARHSSQNIFPHAPVLALYDLKSVSQNTRTIR
jgi:hypothetical protein